MKRAEEKGMRVNSVFHSKPRSRKPVALHALFIQS